MAGIHCVSCGSPRVNRKGPAPIAGQPDRYRFKCMTCGDHFHMSVQTVVTTAYDLFTDDEVNYPVKQYDLEFDDEQLITEDYPPEDNVDEEGQLNWIRDSQYIERLRSKSKFVITSAQNNAEVDEEFLNALHTYCATNDAALIIIPTKLKIVGDLNETVFDYGPSIQPYLVENTIEFPMNKLCILGGMKITPTASNPLSGKDARSKGDSLIFGHPQYQMRTLARGVDRKYPPILSTTGSITKRRYATTNTGEIAKFNHSMGAVVIELTKTDFFIRNLNYDEGNRGFYDMNEWYGQSGVELHEENVTAIVTGDSHVIFHDKEVYDGTFGPDGMLDILRPKYIVRHDILDFHARSHHGTHDHFLEYSKNMSGYNNVEKELNGVVDFLNNTTREGMINIVVCSNHDTHLDRWILSGEFAKDAINAKLGHYISYMKYQHMDENDGESCTGLSAFCRGKLKNETIFLKEPDTFKLHGIELAFHGHAGLNGSRGSAAQFSRMPDKMVVGHSHSPQTNKGCYQVGTSSVFNMDYVKSPSSWDHVHCLIYRNGKRQMIHLRNGKFRA